MDITFYLWNIFDMIKIEVQEHYEVIWVIILKWKCYKEACIDRLTKFYLKAHLQSMLWQIPQRKVIVR